VGLARVLGFVAVATGCARSLATPPVVNTPAKPAEAPKPLTPTRQAAPLPALASGGPCNATQSEVTQQFVIGLATILDDLDEGDDPAPARTALRQLLASPCFDHALAQLPISADSPELASASSLALRAWWDAGGRYSIRLLPTRTADIVFAPDLRTSLAVETHPGHPLAPILCSVRDPECGIDTIAWLRDLERDFERVAYRERDRLRGNDELPNTVEKCTRRAIAKPRGERFDELVGCAGHLDLRPTLPPLGRYKRPTGWLVLRGRRGHYSFCDELRAYHLESGSAYVVQRCSDLVLRTNGSVNQGVTSANANLTTTVGRLSSDAIGRAALVLALKSQLQDDVRREAVVVQVPAAIAIPAPGTGFGSFGFGGGWGSSSQTRLSYALVQDGKTLASGQLTWPDSSDAGDQVADDLIVSAEATLRTGCPAVALPRTLNFRGTLSGVSGLDASKQALDKANGDLIVEMSKLHATPVCKR
jgi:hypothetical protein